MRAVRARRCASKRPLPPPPPAPTTSDETLHVATPADDLHSAIGRTVPLHRVRLAMHTQPVELDRETLVPVHKIDLANRATRISDDHVLLTVRTPCMRSASRARRSSIDLKRSAAPGSVASATARTPGRPFDMCRAVALVLRYIAADGLLLSRICMAVHRSTGDAQSTIVRSSDVVGIALHVVTCSGGRYLVRWTYSSVTARADVPRARARGSVVLSERRVRGVAQRSTAMRRRSSRP